MTQYASESPGPTVRRRCCAGPERSVAMKKLPVLWKRLVVDGRTCARCAGTYDALDGALKQLGAALAPLGIEPELTAEELDAPAFAARPSESNRVWIAGRPLEDWL